MNDATQDGGFVMSLSLLRMLDDLYDFIVHVIKAVFRYILEREEAKPDMKKGTKSILGA